MPGTGTELYAAVGATHRETGFAGNDRIGE